MNHPTQNEWLKYLDGEASPKEVKHLLEHLEQCPMCATELAGWKRSVQKLQRMPFPAPGEVRPGQRRDMTPVFTLVKWGLAAAIVLCAGFAFGRLSAMHSVSLERTVAARVQDDFRRELRADLLAALDPEQEVKDEFQKQLRFEVQNAQTKSNARLYRDFTQVVLQQRQEDQQRVLALVTDVREQQITDCLALRRDLETAVSMADSDLRQNRRQITQLTDTLLTVQK